ncbi:MULTISPECIES: AI-2E family transporter [Roseobacteraceae]|jgi:predicted PurR-regulated permease PerM|uniref:AI-2 transport protein TqsA n=1 Tax=Pseudosulfitobacter pseudonitzschiae TaxID=1402135 RepID=A0A221JXK7_9RHOB|nr:MULTISPECIES: AI-2E family transporter [Roseobacteraceae]ASM71469.1 AI-2 transport protein TqsA [Pseudosulfitobacter pseudonitzschiae]
MRNVTYGTALTLMLGWLLWIGKPVLLPVLASVISVYILLAAAESMKQLPILGRLPDLVRRGMILVVFALFVILLFILVINNLAQVAAVLPRYEQNLENLITRNASLLGIEDEPTWANVRSVTLDQIDFRSWIAPALLSLRGFGTTLFLVVLYASFFIAERGAMTRKVVMAMGGEEAGGRAISVLSRINERIGQYLLVKTTLNVILGAISYVIMLLLGIEFALFWAVLIAFLNYIPYIGSLIGVLFPVLLSLAQFGTLSMTATVLVALTTAQVVVGAYLEPRMMGRAFNLSPFVVLLALAFWSTLWGLPGALLAVPLTASLVIVLTEIPSARPIAVLLSANGKI